MSLGRETTETGGVESETQHSKRHRLDVIVGAPVKGMKCNMRDCRQCNSGLERQRQMVSRPALAVYNSMDLNRL